MESSLVSRMEDLASPGGSRSGAEPFHSNSLCREAALIFGGSGEGIKAAAIQAVNNPGDTAIKLGLSVLVGAGLALGQGRAGLLRQATQVAGLAMGTSFGLDVAHRAGAVAHAVADTWRSDKNFQQDKAVVAATMGPFVVDTAIMSLGGMAGAKIASVPSVYMGVHQSIDKLRGISVSPQHAALQEQMLAYHPGTAYHQERVGALSLLLAKEMRLPPASVEAAYLAGSVHDMGKLNTPLEILDFKGNQLGPADRAVINKHATDTGIILRENVTYPGRLVDVPAVAERHHERLDGKGTPNQLPASEIPIETRVNTVADVFDALSHQRSYKGPTPIDEILAVMRRGRGTQFDPTVVDSLMRQRADRVVGLMLSDGGHVVGKSSLAPFKNVSLGELLEAASAKYPVSTGRVSLSQVSHLNNFYGPAHLRPFTVPPSALEHRLSPAHL